MTLGLVIAVLGLLCGAAAFVWWRRRGDGGGHDGGGGAAATGADETAPSHARPAATLGLAAGGCPQPATAACLER